MNISEIECLLKKACELVLKKKDYVHIERLTFDHYDSETRSLVLYAEDATEALFISSSYSHLLIEALEQIVGPPASIVCKYKPAFSKPHKRFVVKRDV